MAKTWDDFLPLLSPHLSGCPNATMKEYLGIVASDFFARSYLWRAEIDAIYVAPNVTEYELSSDAVVEDVISVVYNEAPLTRSDLRLIGTEKLSEVGEPREYWVQADQSIRVFPTPEARTALKVYAVLKPSRSGTGVEDWIYETWADTLVSGVVARLAMIPNKEWTDVAMATTQKVTYERAITAARVRDFRGVRMMVRQRPAA
jgi:hypothetical protein